MSENMLCTKTHEYITGESGEYTVGLTDYAVEQLGDVVFVELPEVGTKFDKNDVFATVESVKAASEIYMPISGTIIEVNDAISATTEILNESPHKDGWLVKISTDAAEEEFADLLDYADYREELE